VEAASTFTALGLVVVLGAYFFPYEEMQNRRILITGVLPAERWAILAGTAIGIFRTAAILLAAGVCVLAVKVYATESGELLRHVAGRKNYPAQNIVYKGEIYSEGAVSMAPGEEMEVRYRRRGKRGAALRITPYAGARHSVRMAVGAAGMPDEPPGGALVVMGQAVERLIGPDGPEDVTLVVRNLSDIRISVPLSEAAIVEETVPLWANMLRVLALRWIMLLYISLATVGVSAFLGMIPALVVSISVAAGGYLAPFVSALFRLPRFEEGYAETKASYDLVRVVGRVFGDLVTTGPGESLPMGEFVDGARIVSAMSLLINGGVIFAIGCWALSRRELGK